MRAADWDQVGERPTSTVPVLLLAVAGALAAVAALLVGGTLLLLELLELFDSMGPLG